MTAQTREYECTRYVLPQVIARGRFALWSTVSHVEIGGVKHKYAVVGTQISCDISLYPRRTSNSPISSLQPVREYTLTENWAAKIRCDCVRNVIGEEYREVVPYTRTVNPSPDPDSDDDV